MNTNRTSEYVYPKKGMQNMVGNGLLVFIVDDDEAMRESLVILMQSAGYRIESYTSGMEFLEAWTEDKRGCMILDINLPDISGLELQKILSERGIDLPIVFLTGFGDVPKSSTAFKAGAVNFLEKPVAVEILLEGVQEALELSSRLLENEAHRNQVATLYGHLTPREKEIIVFLARGYSAKQIGRALNISHRTAEIHRARIMEKLGAESLADLVALAIQMGVR